MLGIRMGVPKAITICQIGIFHFMYKMYATVATHSINIKITIPIKTFPKKYIFFIARGLGFEPKFSPSKGEVLPLDDPLIS